MIPKSQRTLSRRRVIKIHFFSSGNPNLDLNHQPAQYGRQQVGIRPSPRLPTLVDSLLDTARYGREQHTIFRRRTYYDGEERGDDTSCEKMQQLVVGNRQ